MTKRLPKILFLTHRLPFPPIGGDRVKAWHLLKHLAKVSDLDVIALDETGQATAENRSPIEKLTRLTVVPFNKQAAALRIVKSILSTTPIEFTYYNSPEMQSAVDKALSEKKYDLIIPFFLRTACYVDSVKNTPKLLIAEDARIILEERATKRFEFTPEYLVRKIDAGRLHAYEPKMMEKFDRVTFVGKADESRIKQERPHLATRILTNGVDLSQFSFNTGSRKNELVFCGHLGVYHNRLMVERLIERLWTRIHASKPDWTLKIVGAKPSANLARKIQSTAGATLHADVPDVTPFLASASIFLHPQSIGAGIQNKLLEALAVGTPVITTPVGAEGIAGFENGTHGLVAETDDALIHATLHLMDDAELRNMLSLDGRRLIEKRYTWETIYDTLDEIISELLPGFRGSIAGVRQQSFKTQVTPPLVVS